MFGVPCSLMGRAVLLSVPWSTVTNAPPSWPEAFTCHAGVWSNSCRVFLRSSLPSDPNSSQASLILSNLLFSSIMSTVLSKTCSVLFYFLAPSLCFSLSLSFLPVCEAGRTVHSWDEKVLVHILSSSSLNITCRGCWFFSAWEALVLVIQSLCNHIL